jgi:hypothetical protein
MTVRTRKGKEFDPGICKSGFKSAIYLVAD